MFYELNDEPKIWIIIIIIIFNDFLKKRFLVDKFMLQIKPLSAKQTLCAVLAQSNMDYKFLHTERG